MTQERISDLGPAESATIQQALPGLALADIMNRIYIVAMFAVVILIGGFGVYSLDRGQKSSDLVDQTFLPAKDAAAMGTALDQEYSQLLASMRQPRPDLPEQFVRATRSFERARIAATQDGGPAIQPLLKTLGPNHAAFDSASHAIVRALSGGNTAYAKRIDAQTIRPAVTAIRKTLDEVSAASFRASEAEDAKDERFEEGQKRVIIAITAIGIILMVGIAALIQRYKRSANAATAAVLNALQKAALTDNLTGLGNNRSFFDDFERELARATRYDHHLTLALVDVDDFKAVNDGSGHPHGDAVLAAVGERLRSMRQGDRAYRIGGDEFAILLVETEPSAASLVLARLQTSIREAALGATVSVGYVNLAGAQLSTESYELADTALYEAKRLGRNQTVCFESIRGAVTVFSPRKAETVRALITNGLVSVAFQPIWDVPSTRPLGFEALARPHPDLGLAGPQEAFDVAQRIRQLPELDNLCTRRALEAAVNLPAGSVIFLNYSPASLTHAGFHPQTFVDTVRAAGLLPKQIVIELTERRIDDPTIVVQRVAALRELGVRVALDDTGTGHAGLEVLSKVRFDFVKIDRGLVVDAMENRAARGVLAGIIAIARETGSYLIAEGIETPEMLDFVSQAHASGSESTGIRGIQGYLLGRPETGSLDLTSLERCHDFLAERALERPIGLPIEVVRGEDLGSPTVRGSAPASIA
jgi:diguanylate cyclase (GGDEF)-like protein